MIKCSAYEMGKYFFFLITIDFILFTAENESREVCLRNQEDECEGNREWECCLISLVAAFHDLRST